MDQVPVPPESSPLKGFWARSAVIVAVVATFEFVWGVAEPGVLSALGERATVLLRVAAESWLIALGFTRASPSKRVE